MGLISVTGVAKSSLAPNQIEISILLSADNKIYEKAADALNCMVKKVVDAVKASNLSEQALTTSNYNAESVYENIYVDNNHSRKHVGYKCTNSLMLRFDYDVKKINEVLTNLSQSGTNAELNLFFTVKKQDDINRQLLKDATQNAIKKAELLAESANVKIKGIESISARSDEPSYNSPSVCRPRMAFCMDSGAVASVNPENIEVSASVDMTFSIA